MIFRGVIKIKKIHEKLEYIMETIFRHSVSTSVVFSVFISILYFFNILKDIKNVLPHIITLSTVMLTVMGLVYTVIISIRDGKIYKLLKERLSKATDELYHLLKQSILLCVVVVLIAIAIMVTNVSNIYAKYCICMLASYMFSKMLCSSTSAFLISVSLLEADDKNNK